MNDECWNLKKELDLTQYIFKTKQERRKGNNQCSFPFFLRKSKTLSN